MAGIFGIASRGLGMLAKGKKKLSFGDKFKMQSKGIINKKTGRLNLSHESAFRGLSKREVGKMTRTGQNPRLSPAKPGKFLSKRQFEKNKATTRKEAQYFRGRKFK